MHIDARQRAGRHDEHERDDHADHVEEERPPHPRGTNDDPGEQRPADERDIERHLIKRSGGTQELLAHEQTRQ